MGIVNIRMINEVPFEEKIKFLEGFLEEIPESANNMVISDIIDKIGCSAHIQKVFTEDDKSGVFLQIYTECVLPFTPSDKSVGYTFKDVNIRSGVMLVDVMMENSKPIQQGEAFDGETVLKGNILKEKSKEKLKTIFENMRDRVYPEHENLEIFSKLYREGFFKDKERKLH